MRTRIIIPEKRNLSGKFFSMAMTYAARNATARIVTDNSRKGNWINEIGKKCHKKLLNELLKKSDNKPMVRKKQNIFFRLLSFIFTPLLFSPLLLSFPTRSLSFPRMRESRR